MVQQSLHALSMQACSGHGPIYAHTWGMHSLHHASSQSLLIRYVPSPLSLWLGVFHFAWHITGLLMLWVSQLTSDSFPRFRLVFQAKKTFSFYWNNHSLYWRRFSIVKSIYYSITVNYRLTGPGKMVKLCLLFVGIQRQKCNWYSSYFELLLLIYKIEATNDIVLQLWQIGLCIHTRNSKYKVKNLQQEQAQRDQAAVEAKARVATKHCIKQVLGSITAAGYETLYAFVDELLNVRW